MNMNGVEDHWFEVTHHSFPLFDYHVWADHLKHLEVMDAQKTLYRPLGTYETIQLSDTELVGVRRAIKPLLKDLTGRLNTCLEHGPAFFRLSTRSPKDAWQTLNPDLGIDETDNEEQQNFKLAAQCKLCLVSHSDDVFGLITCSERLKEDIDLSIEQGHEIRIILQTWRDIPPRSEYRIFVRERILIAYTAYHPGQTNQQVTHQVFDHFVNKMLHVLPSSYQDIVIDVWIHAGRVYLIELNPFHETTDPMVYNWEQLKTMPLSQ